MAGSSLVETTVDAILARIVAGEFRPGTRVPGQDELATLLGVSRLTVREAVKQLQGGRILRVEHGTGTWVRPWSEWTDLHAVSMVAGAQTRSTAQALIEVRRMFEVAAASLAAARRTGADLALLQAHLDGMAEATMAHDVDEFVRHDLAFHATIIQACGNPFLAAMYEPLHKELSTARRQTSAVADIRDHALVHHRAVLAALQSGDPTAAAAAMDAHMTQTSDDLATLVEKLEA